MINKTIYISDAFSLQMFSIPKGKAKAKKISLKKAKNLAGIALTVTGWSTEKNIQRGFVNQKYLPAKSVIGHGNIYKLINTELGLTVGEHKDWEMVSPLYYEPNQTDISLNPGDKVVVALYIGPQLTEKTKELPTNAEILWYLVTVIDIKKKKKAIRKIEEEIKNANAFHQAALAKYYGGDSGAIEEAARERFPGIFENIGK